MSIDIDMQMSMDIYKAMCAFFCVTTSYLYIYSHMSIDIYIMQMDICNIYSYMSIDIDMQMSMDIHKAMCAFFV